MKWRFWRRPRYVVGAVKTDPETGEKWVRLDKASYDDHRITTGTILAAVGRFGRRVGGSAPGEEPGA